MQMPFLCSRLPAAAPLSLLLGGLTLAVWKRTPAPWLTDRGEPVVALPHRQPSAPLPWIPLLALPYLFFFLFQRSTSLEGALVLSLLRLFLLSLITLGDIRFQIIPDQWTAALALVSLLDPTPAPGRWMAAALPFLLYALAALAARRAGGRPGLGGGDVKLLSALGLAHGSAGLAYIASRAFMLAGLWALGLLLTKKAAKGDRLAFGPFAALFACAYMVSTRCM